MSLWLRPRDLDEALTGLRDGWTVVGGGAALASESFAPTMGERALDLAGLGLDAVRASAGGLRIGAMTTLEYLLGLDAIVVDRPAIAAAVRAIATPEVRRIATAGGSVAARLPTGDLTPVLCAHRARLDLLESSGERTTIALADYLDHPRDAIVLAIDAGPPRAGVFRRFAGRPGFAPALASVVAVRHPDGLEIWAGAVAAAPIRIAAIDLPDESQLRNDDHASAWYRRQLIATLRDDVLEALSIPKENS